MQCSAEDKEARKVQQQEAQTKLDEQKSQDKDKRLKELEGEKTKAMLKAASGRK